MSCHYYAFISVLLWASSYVGIKVVGESFGAGSLALTRCLVAAATLGIVLIVRRLPPIGWKDMPRMILPGLTGLSLFLVLVNRGLASIGPTTSSVVIALSPIITAFLAFLAFRERIRPLGWLAMFIAFGGIAIIALWNGTLEINPGVLWTLAAALSMGVYNILQRRLSRDFPPLQAAFGIFFVAAASLLFYVPEAVADLRGAPAGHVLICLYTGVFCSGVAYLCWGKALAIASRTSIVSNYMFLTPLLALLLDFALVSRLPDAGTMLGGVFILGGLALFSLAGKK